MKKENKQLSDILDFIVDKSFEIIQWKIIAATDQTTTKDPWTLVDGLPEGYMNFDHGVLDSMLAMVKPLLGTAQQTQKVKAETAKDIIKLIGSGKLNISEAMTLMEIIKKKIDIEEKEMSNDLKKKMSDLID